VHLHFLAIFNTSQLLQLIHISLMNFSESFIRHLYVAFY